MDGDEVRLANPRKTKVLSVRLDSHQQQTEGAGRNSPWRLGPQRQTFSALHLWDIDDGEMLSPYTTTAANGL